VESSFLNPQSALSALQLLPGETVADFDAGSGFFTRAAARLVRPGAVWAVDANRELLPRLKNTAELEGLDNIEVVSGSIEHVGGTKLPDHGLDAVIIANSLFACDHKDAVAKEAARVLKPRGRVLVIDWADSFGGMGPHPGHVVSAEAATKLFEAEGFTMAGEANAGLYHWGLLFKKSGRADH
jgi:ubiquinone/menaquinone biosynthesis C-methylase UbiE